MRKARRTLKKETVRLRGRKDIMSQKLQRGRICDMVRKLLESSKARDKERN